MTWGVPDLRRLGEELSAQAWGLCQVGCADYPSCDLEREKEALKACWLLRPQPVVEDLAPVPLARRMHAEKVRQAHWACLQPVDLVEQAALQSPADDECRAQARWLCRDGCPLSCRAWKWLLADRVLPLLAEAVKPAPRNLLANFSAAMQCVRPPPRAHALWVAMEAVRVACAAVLPPARWNLATYALAHLKTLGDDVMKNMDVHDPSRGSSWDCYAAQQIVRGTPGWGTVDLAEVQEVAAVGPRQEPLPDTDRLLWSVEHRLPLLLSRRARAWLVEALRDRAEELAASGAATADLLYFTGDAAVRHWKRRCQDLLDDLAVLDDWHKGDAHAPWRPKPGSLQVRLAGASSYMEATCSAQGVVTLVPSGQLVRLAPRGAFDRLWTSEGAEAVLSQLPHGAQVRVRVAASERICEGRVEHRPSRLARLLTSGTVIQWGTGPDSFPRLREQGTQRELRGLADCVPDMRVEVWRYEAWHPAQLQLDPFGSLVRLESGEPLAWAPEPSDTPVFVAARAEGCEVELLRARPWLRAPRSLASLRRHRAQGGLTDADKNAAMVAARDIKRLREDPTPDELLALTGLDGSASAQFLTDWDARQARLRRRIDEGPLAQDRLPLFDYFRLPLEQPPAEYHDLVAGEPRCEKPGCPGILQPVERRQRIGLDELASHAMACNYCSFERMVD